MFWNFGIFYWLIDGMDQSKLELSQYIVENWRPGGIFTALVV